MGGANQVASAVLKRAGRCVYVCAGRDRGWPAIDIECGCGLCGPRVIACVIAGAVAGEGEGVL